MTDNTPHTTVSEELPTAPDAAEKPALVRNKYADTMNKRKLPKKFKIGLTLVILTLLVTGSVWLVKKAQSTGTAQQTMQQTAFATRGALETFVEGNGRTAAKSKYDLGKELKGIVTEVQVTSGDAVHKGDVLFIVDPKDTRKDLDAAISELDDAQRAVDEAASALQKAQKSVSNLTITAPFSGKVIPNVDDKGVSKTYKVGQSINTGDVIGTMVDDTTMRLPLYFNYSYLNQVKVGATASVSIPASMSTVTGKVAEIEKSQRVSDDGVMLFRVIITLSNPGTLKKDMLATASITTAQGTLMPAEAGKLSYAREEEITAKSAGTITSINNLDYYRYSAGAVLCKLQSDDTVTAVGTAQRTLETAQKTVQSKQTRVAELQKLITDSTVISPIDGIVLNMSAAAGDKLEGNSTPCTVADLSSLIVKADISELDIGKVQVGMEVRLTLDNDAATAYTGKVETVSLQSDNNNSGGGNTGGGNGQGSTLSFPAVIHLDSIDNLRPEQSISYKIVTASKADCITVPSSAIVYTDSGAAVYMKPAEGQTPENTIPSPEGSNVPDGFVLVPVTTGLFDDTNTEIVSGIEEGVEVYLSGPQDPFAQQNADAGAAVAAG